MIEIFVQVGVAFIVGLLIGRWFTSPSAARHSKSVHGYDLFEQEYWKGGLGKEENKSCGFGEEEIFEIIGRYVWFDSVTLEICRECCYCERRTVRGVEYNNVWWWTYVFGHTIPTREAIGRIRERVGGKTRALSVGAGKGLWEYLLAKGGWDVICTDLRLNEMMFKKMEIVGKSDVFEQLIGRGVISNVGDIDVLIIIWSAPDVNEFGYFDVHNGYDERALKRFVGKYVVFVCDKTNDPVIGTVGAKAVLADKFKIIDSVDLPHCSGYLPVLKIYERVEPII
ncbi:MAG: hypothetical protein Hyperionvirus22_25 [Hyperionvirus sp.]|uniref:Uncharacterized protein n=1 Tax=Hyperionvirus sp. TaxID=2487770 RepID=A0A3G5ACJ9_9VIRU|nr:MAG: hypothetical protein Hyperionvirus22_25 [Hyperionvirus sp.]